MDVQASKGKIPTDQGASVAVNSCFTSHLNEDIGHGIEGQPLSSSSYSDLTHEEKMLMLKTIDVCMEKGPSWLETLREQNKEELKFLEEGSRGHNYFMKILYSRLKKGWGEHFA